MITFSSVQFTPEMLRRYQALFHVCFAEAKKFSPSVLKWLYVDNPDGGAVGFDAFDGDQLAAHYVCIPATVRIDGNPVRALLSLHTATHPSYQGQGLFTKLAAMTYEAATAQGFHSVYGVANANSTPGFVRKLGFQLVEPLKAMIGVYRLGIDFPIASRSAQFERAWTPASLKWRCGNPANPVASFSIGDRLGFHARAFGLMLPAYAELSADGVSSIAGSSAPLSPFRLYLGLVPEGSCNFSTYVSIPQRLRPSPLNMIYRPLSANGGRLNAGYVHFSFLDFDAY